ncbi:alpha-L-fucosidase [Aporhodopirellula aestuarii]|uniref:alpha-L-fucosidase n=1 Tax=Aporhodopirellula aestuarii TaxID=2950107 RepID=A0ABT0UAL8_9BACT|nr:alpha-L-fucosidase [Aporhodopirellula aestuarii]MCM2373950.1 alpha-L-fucosidase [Aporhodopirellula aestuarii]
MKTILECIIVVGLLLAVFAPESYAQSESSKGKVVNDQQREEEFMDWGLGMFVHWSLDSQLGSVISHSMVGANERYLDRYINELPQTFNPKKYDPDEWMAIAKLAGAKYMVLTTKHHSGFCLWDTKTTDFGIMSTPYKKDIVREYVDACRKTGLKVGFYFSPEDFYFLRQQGHVIRRTGEATRISENQELLEYDKRQIKELLTDYGPIDVVFLDAFDSAQIRDYVHDLQPKCLVTRGEMATPEQKIPDAPIPGPWESCFTLGTQWQFKPTNEDYKNGGKLIDMLIETRAKGGNLLINIGPEPSGIIPPEQERIFRELGLWMFINDEAIHDVRPSKVIRENKIWYTQSKDGKTVYVFLTEFTGKNRWNYGERKEIVLKSWKATEQTRVSVLGQNDKVLEYKPDADPTSRFKQTEAGLELSVMRAQRIYNDKTWPNTVVLKLENVEFVENRRQ